MYMIKDKAQMPYERFLRGGSKSLTDLELLALVLRNGSKDRDVFSLCEDILQAGNGSGLLNLHQLSVEELTRIPGVGTVTAVKLKSIAEIAIRLSSQSKKQGLPVFLGASDVADYYMERFRHEEVEKCFLLMFDTRMHLIKESLLCSGTVKEALLSPRELFALALRHQAVSVILLHNHPGGDPAPSKADREITGRIAALGDMMQVPLLDHIILGDRYYYSFKEKGAL